MERTLVQYAANNDIELRNEEIAVMKNVSNGDMDQSEM